MVCSGLSFPPSLPSSLVPSLPPSIPHPASLPASLPPFLPPSLPSSLPPLSLFLLLQQHGRIKMPGMYADVCFRRMVGMGSRCQSMTAPIVSRAWRRLLNSKGEGVCVCVREREREREREGKTERSYRQSRMEKVIDQQRREREGERDREFV